MATQTVQIHLTLRGLILGILSALLATGGIYRKELASILWGIGMGSLLLCILIFSAFAFVLLYRKKEHLLQHLTLIHPTAHLFAGNPLTFQVSLPPHLLRGFNRIPSVMLRYLYRVTACKGRTYSWAARIDPKDPSFSLTPPPPERGDYQGLLGYLQIEDSFGFCRIDMPLPEKEHLLILPTPYPTSILPMLPGRGGIRIREHRSPSISIEELEIRKYQPGDDIRRLHWKLYAHSGELFFRIGEQDPPPVDTFHLHFDPSLPPKLAASLHLPAVDLMASIGARVLTELSKAGKRILLSKNPPTPTDRPQNFWFSHPVLELEVGHPEPGLAALARLVPESLLMETSPDGLPRALSENETRGSSRMDSPPLPLSGRASRGTATRGSSRPLASSAGHPTRVLFLFLDSPGAETLPLPKVNAGDKPWSFFTFERPYALLKATPTEVILIDPRKGPQHAHPL